MRWRLIAIHFLIHPAIECEPLPDIANGRITYAEDTTPNFDLGTVATYECDDGYYLMGEDQRNCTAGDGSSAIGVFEGQAPTCVRKLKLFTLAYVCILYIHIE